MFLDSLESGFMRLLSRMFLAALTFAAVSSVQAQAPFPSDSLKTASSIATAFSALGIGGAEPSGYLLLDAPDVAAPGKVKAMVGSEIPGTIYLVLLRGTPVNPTAVMLPTALARPHSATPAPAPNVPLPALVAAKKFAPSARASLTTEVELGCTQWLTLVAFAQGRWFVTAREIKVGKLRQTPHQDPR